MRHSIISSSIVFSLIFFACNKAESSSCNVNDPLADLAWLKQIKTNFDLDMSPTIQRIDQYLYNDRTVFKISICGGCTDAMDEVYDCDGTKICEFGGIMGKNTCPDFQDKSKFIKNLYNQ